MKRRVAVTASFAAMKVGLLATVMVTAAIEPSVAQGTSSVTPGVLADGVGARMKRVENLHKVRFIEIFLAFRDARTGKLVAACYSPLFTPQGIPASRDTAPQKLVEGLEFAKMKTDYGVLGASLNGPKLWLSDWAELDTGVERDFNGIKTVWVAQLDMGDNAAGVSESPGSRRWKRT